jgi:hypothetical protein
MPSLPSLLREGGCEGETDEKKEVVDSVKGSR